MGSELLPSGGDDTAAIQAALNSGDAPIGFGVFNISGPLVVSKSGTRCRGRGAGFAISGTGIPTILNYIGPPTAAPVIRTEGQISDLDFGSFAIACNAKCGGVDLRDFSGSTISRLKVANNAANSIALAVIGGDAPTGHYNVFNKFSQISVGLFQPSSVGLYMDGNYAAMNDTWISAFELARFETVAGAVGAVCAWLKFVDSCTFTRCHIEPRAEPGSYGLILDALNNHDYPAGLMFRDCSIGGPIVVYEDGLHKIRKNSFIGFGTYDNEPLPTHPKLIGITDQGVPFNGFGV